jgi:ribose 5-phosphate isomerase A
LAVVATSAEDDLSVLGDAAAAYVEDGMRIGLGTGRAATAFIRALGARFAGRSARLSCVATSEATAKLASSLGLPLVSLTDAGELDLTVDGADEVDPRLDLIKGLGGALVREKIVAASSRRLVIVVGVEKLVSRLGVVAPVPVEVLAFAMPLCRRRLAALGADPTLRSAGSVHFVSDNGNPIFDCAFHGIEDAATLDRAIREIPGVVGTGLFVGMAERVLVQDGNRVDVRRRPT